ncbi:MarR family winged helix-turn-helix transcriptional regulator [Bordetella genomosp. 13]|uniref:MarR family winged helix-turn-helix transcriptional regulator n=1 Tax=Bordetella genomosp. 13 TaxID=463040 RepID=UPI0011A36CDA|nr:MarR family transcriptional regulator [Bordetella genomosp. 13]
MPERIPIEDLITFKTSVLAQLLARVVDASVGTDLGLSSRQWRTMITVHRLGPVTPSEIARFSHLDKSQISRAVFEAEKAGLLVQATDEADRRRTIVSLTPEGLAVLEKGLRGTRQRQKALEDSLAPEDRAALHRILDTLTAQARGMLARARANKE